MEYNNTFQIMKHEKIPYVSELPNTQKPLPLRTTPIYIKELRDLTSKTNYKDKSMLFYKSLLYYDIIINQAIKQTNINLNYDLVVLNAFYLGMKFTQNQINLPRISQLKHMNKKYASIDSNALITNEIICLQLMDYSLVYSSSYDFMLMTLQNKDNVFTKARDYLDKFISSSLSTCYSPYSIASVIINYTMSVLGYRDPLLMKRFYVDKKSPCYQTITNSIHQFRDVSNESTLASDERGSYDQSFRGGVDKTQDIVAARYKKIRQLSKNIDLSLTNEYYEINKTLMDKEKEDLKEDENEDTDEVVNNMNEPIKKLMFVKEQTRRSCNNIFSNVSISKNLLKKAGTISINSGTNNGNCHHHQSTNTTCFSGKKVNAKLNIDIRLLSKFNLNHAENVYSKIKINKVAN